MFGFPQGKEITEWLETDGKAKMAKLQKMIDEADFSYKEGQEIYKIARDREAWVDWKDHDKGKETLHEEAIIQLVRAPGVKTFINKVNKEFGFNFPIPFPHISLATKGTKFGIGIADQGAFKELNPVEINNKERSIEHLKSWIKEIEGDLKNIKESGIDEATLKASLAEAKADLKYELNPKKAPTKEAADTGSLGNSIKAALAKDSAIIPDKIAVEGVSDKFIAAEVAKLTNKIKKCK